MCLYCEENRKTMEDEHGEYSMKVTKLIPFPTIDLTTGEVEKTAPPPYYALFLYLEEDHGEEASFPINYCPMCGRKL